MLNSLKGCAEVDGPRKKRSMQLMSLSQSLFITFFTIFKDLPSTDMAFDSSEGHLGVEGSSSKGIPFKDGDRR